MFFWTDIMFYISEHVTEQRKVNIIVLIEFLTFSSDPKATSDQQGPEDFLPTTSSTPSSPISPTCLSESPTSPTSPTDAATASTEISSIKPRRRNGRPRPRPISDYGQLISRKHSIPEEVSELQAEERTAKTSLHKDCSGDDACGNGESPESCSMNGDVHGMRQRPISVIGVVDLFSPDAEEKDERLPSVRLYSYSLNLLVAYSLWKKGNS